MNEIGNASGVIRVLAGLFVFGLLYNWAVGWLENRGYDEGYTSFLVVVGVLVTLGGVAVLDWRAALLTVAAFVFSGVPMIVGSWWRHVQARRRAQDALRGT